MYPVGRPLSAAPAAPQEVVQGTVATMGQPVQGLPMSAPVVVGIPDRPHQHPPVQMGMAPAASHAQPVQAQPVLTPAQATGEVCVPKGLAAGDRFDAETADGQTVSILVPPGVEPGSTITFSYTPIVRGSVVTVTGHPMLMGQATLGRQWGTEMELTELGALGLEQNRLEGAHLELLDRQASQQAWFLYIVGCLLCCCSPHCMLVAPFVWFSVAAVHMCRPPSQRAQLHRERAVAIFAAITFLLPAALVMIRAFMHVDEVCPVGEIWSAVDHACILAEDGDDGMHHGGMSNPMRTGGMQHGSSRDQAPP
mmetsp:Transcript_22609/g.41644  ORF Transcript_22609/g.41644 Transcript_22609/m.41644 type:complete len:309 (+) Transcript_22609:74-1000(+)